MTNLFRDAYDGTPINADIEYFYFNTKRSINHAIVHEYNLEAFILSDGRYSRATIDIIREDFRQVSHRPQHSNPYGIPIVPYGEFLKFLSLFISPDSFREPERRFDSFLRYFIIL